MNSDFKDLLNILNDRDAKYLVIGGYAVMYYSEPRYTKDIDIWVEATPENAAKVFAAMRDFGAPLSGISIADFSQEGFFYQIGVPPVRVDILMSVTGLSFAEAWPRRNQVELEGTPVNLVSRGDLITIKRAYGRHIDLHDADLLEKGSS